MTRTVTVFFVLFLFPLSLAAQSSGEFDYFVEVTSTDSTGGDCLLQDYAELENSQEGATCTLGEAIEQANTTTDTERVHIRFALGAGSDEHVIEVSQHLPYLTAAGTTIDGTTQPGYRADWNDPRRSVILKVQEPEYARHQMSRLFYIDAEGTSQAPTVIKGLNIQNVPREAIFVSIFARHAVIADNFINSDPFGDAVKHGGHNDTRRVSIEGSNVVVNRNVIVGGTWNIGVHDGATNVSIEDNVLGHTLTSSKPMNDSYWGIYVFDGISSNTTRSGHFFVGNSVASRTEGIHLADGFGHTLRRNTIRAGGEPGPHGGWYQGDGSPIYLASGVNSDIPAPTIEWAEYIEAGHEEGIEADGEVEVSYRVDADPDAFVYPLTVEFFYSPDGDGNPEEYLGSHTYSLSKAYETETFNAFAPEYENVARTGFLVATVTDAEGNTSMLSEVDPSAQLPVEFAAFDVQFDSGAALLSWSTLSETNNAGFHVQREVAGAFQDVPGAYVEGAGTVNNQQSYRYELEGLAPGEHTFRLRQVDFDGTESFSADRSVAVPATLEIAGPYPNPFADRTQVDLTVPNAQHVTVSVYDALGRQVATLFAGEARSDQPLRLTFDAAGLSSGMYLIRAEGETFSEVRRATFMR